MAFIDDLSKSVALFNQGLQRFQTTRAFGEAQEQLDIVNNSLEEGIQRRAAQQQISTNLGQALAVAGQSPRQAAQASALFAPIATEEEQLESLRQQAIAKTAGTLGVTERAAVLREEAATTARTFEAEEARKERTFKTTRAQETATLKRELAVNKEDATTSKKKELKPSQLKSLIGLDKQRTIVSSLLDRFNRNPDLEAGIGPFVGREPDITVQLRSPVLADFRAELGRFFDAYRKEITGVAAGEKEIVLLQQNIPRKTDTPEVLTRKLETLIEIGDRVRNSELNTLEKAGFELGDLKQRELLPRATEVDPTDFSRLTGKQLTTMSPEQLQRVPKDIRLRLFREANSGR